MTSSSTAAGGHSVTKQKSELLTKARKTLQLAVKLAPLIPVPYVSCIFESAQIIVNAASQMRENKQQSAELAEYAAQLTHEVHRAIHGRERFIDDDLKTTLQQLQNGLKEIQEFMEKQVTLTPLQHIMKRGTVTEELNAHRNNLQYTMNTFTTTSHIQTRMMLQGIENRLIEQKEDLVVLRDTAAEERKYDKKNRYRIYREGEVYRLRRHTLMDSQRADIVQKGASIEYYDAEVEGRVRILKRYHDLETFQQALDILETLSKCPTVNVAQLEGHSPMNSIPSFLVLKGDLRPFLPYIMSLADAPRYLMSLRSMASIVDTIIFLWRYHLTWTNEVNKLMLNGHGEVVLGINNDIKLCEQPSKSARVPILTDWNTRDDGTLSYRRSKPLSPDKMRSEQLTIGALQCALSHPDPRHWTINDIAGLWHQYITEWGTILPSSMKMMKIAILEPSMGFGCLLQDIHGKPQFRNLYPIPFDDQCLRIRSYYVPLDGLAIPSNYSLFHGLSSLTNTGHLCATVRRVMPLISAWDYMLHYGPIHAKHHGVKLKDLIFVYQVVQKLSAFLNHKDSIDVQFHVQPPNDDGFLPEPWGYFSTKHGPSQANETIPVQCQGVDNTIDKLLFSNNPPGVSAEIRHYYKISYIQLHPRDAAFVEWIHDHFSQSSSSVSTL